MMHPDAAIDTIYHESIIHDMMDHDVESSPSFETLLNPHNWSDV